MRASVLTKFGPPDVLQLREVDKPVPKDRDVLIRVHAASVGFGDMIARDFAAVTPEKFHMPRIFLLFSRMTFGFKKPRVIILGSEFAGRVEAVGKRVTRFKAGDPVFGYRGPRMGAYADYLSMPENGVLAAKPESMTYDQAAASPFGAIMALGLLRKLRLQPGQNVLVVGASGGIGSAVVRLAKSHFGASVTGVCGPAGQEYVRSLGADEVIDYTKEDFQNRPETYDVIIDILGKSAYSLCKRILRPRGRLVYVSFKMKQILQMLTTSVRGGKKVICTLLAEKQEDLVAASELMEAGTIQTIVDRAFPLEQAADAHRYAESGAKKGYVVLSLMPASAQR